MLILEVSNQEEGGREMACSRRENRGFHRALCKAVEREGSRSNTQEVIKTEAPNCSPMCPLSTPKLAKGEQGLLHPVAAASLR